MVCGTLKTCCAGVAFFVLTVGASAKTCVWSGDAKDGKWSTAENWVDGAVPADGDIVSVSGAYGSDMENDIDNLSVSRIWFLGEDAVRLTGKALSIKATVEKAWTNQCPLECQVPLKFSPMSNSGVWNIYATCEKETHFYQKIESTSGCRLNLYSTFVSGQNNRHVYFHAPVVGAQISVLPCGGHFHFYESLTNSNYISSSSYSDKGSACKACFYKPLKYGYMNLAFKHHRGILQRKMHRAGG